MHEGFPYSQQRKAPPGILQISGMLKHLLEVPTRSTNYSWSLGSACEITF